jgi:hypothetical protein
MWILEYIYVFFRDCFRLQEEEEKISTPPISIPYKIKYIEVIQPSKKRKKSISWTNY